MRFGFRKIEAIVGTLIFTVLAIFVFEVFISSPQLTDILNGFVPHKEIVTNQGILYIALGIIGRQSCLTIYIYILQLFNHVNMIDMTMKKSPSN